MISHKNLTPDQFKARLSEFLTGGPCETFYSHYLHLYNDAMTVAHEDEDIRELKEEVDQLRVALQDANMDLLEARNELAKLKAKPNKKG